MKWIRKFWRGGYLATQGSYITHVPKRGVPVFMTFSELLTAEYHLKYQKKNFEKMFVRKFSKNF